MDILIGNLNIIIIMIMIFNANTFQASRASVAVFLHVEGLLHKPDSGMDQSHLFPA